MMLNKTVRWHDDSTTSWNGFEGNCQIAEPEGLGVSTQ